MHKNVVAQDVACIGIHGHATFGDLQLGPSVNLRRDFEPHLDDYP